MKKFFRRESWKNVKRRNVNIVLWALILIYVIATLAYEIVSPSEITMLFHVKYNMYFVGTILRLLISAVCLFMYIPIVISDDIKKKRGDSIGSYTLRIIVLLIIIPIVITSVMTAKGFMSKLPTDEDFESINNKIEESGNLKILKYRTDNITIVNDTVHATFKNRSYNKRQLTAYATFDYDYKEDKLDLKDVYFEQKAVNPFVFNLLLVGFFTMFHKFCTKVYYQSIKKKIKKEKVNKE